MSPHRVIMMLAAMLAVAVADFTFEDPQKCWDIIARLELSADDQLKVHPIREYDYTCKEPGWNLYYRKKGKLPVTNFRMWCTVDNFNYYMRAVSNDIDDDGVTLIREDKIFCATNILQYCEEEAKKLFSDNDVTLNDEETGFVCKSDGSRAFFKKYSTSKPQQTNDFLCVHGVSDGPHKIQALHLNEVHELGKKSSIFCKGSNSATNTQTQPSQQPSPVPPPQQPSSDFLPPPQQSGSNPAPPLQQPSFGPAPHQQQPSSGFVPHQQQSGSNPLLPQLQQCSCHCPVAQAQYHGYPAPQAQYPGYHVPQPQYSGYPAPQYPAYPSGKKRSPQAQYQAYSPAPPPGYGPMQQCLCYCDGPANPSAPVQNV